MKKFTFDETWEIRNSILDNNKNNDFVFYEGKNNVLISVPHGVPQTRLGKQKYPEMGSIQTGKILADNTNSHILIKTTNNFDDANFDEKSLYRDKIKEIIKAFDIKYLIDIHGLSKQRKFDVNLGTNLGNNIKKDEEKFDLLMANLQKDFSVSIDQPFMGSKQTICGYFSKAYDLWTLQIEINCGLTNYAENIEKFNLLIDVLICWIKKL